MKFGYFIFYILYFIVSNIKVTAQNSNLNVNLGITLGDALVISNYKYPSIGLDYEKAIRKYVKINISSGIYKTTFLESYVQNQFHTILENSINSNHPFISIDELNTLMKLGFKQLDPKFNLYNLSIPLDLGLIFLPISMIHHELGIGVNFGWMYSNHNHPRDQYPGFFSMNGKEYPITLLINTEYREFAPTFSGSILYNYKFKDYLLGIQIKNYNYFFPQTQHILPIWIPSLKMGYRF